MPGSEPSLNIESLAFLEDAYADYLKDPASVTPDWREYFDDMRPTGHGDALRAGAPPTFAQRSSLPGSDTHGSNGATANGEAAHGTNRFDSNGGETATEGAEALQERVDQLVRDYRVRGHIVAQLDPLGQPRPAPPELDPGFYGFTEADLNRRFSTKWMGGADERTLREIIDWLKNTYCRTIGAQFMHIDSLKVRQWLQHRMESTGNRLELPRSAQMRILRRLTDATVFEEFLWKKYPGAKTFSLAGAESLIPLLDLAIEKAGEDGVKDIVLAMAHRGRLNVLSNIMGKSPRRVFREFDDVDPNLHTGDGDVKYHLGHSSDWVTATGKKVHITLCFNPSHLEFVNTVAQGRMRAKQDRMGDIERRNGMAILIHGDAAFAGEGIVQETLNLSQLNGYSVGGTIHVVVNNQVGFTTNPSDARSCTYATDVAKMLHSPIFHVNGEDPEAVAQVLQLSLDFRKTFQRDVVIDMYCYRLKGHNEGDEPSFTQPMMYRAIERRKSVRDSYLDYLLALGGISVLEAKKIVENSQQHLEQELKAAREPTYKAPTEVRKVWTEFIGGPESAAVDVNTGVDAKVLMRLLKQQTEIPDDFRPHPKIVRLLAQRVEIAEGKRPLDWAAGEAAAFASLLVEGVRVRLSGQDCARGTFSHRHAVLHDVTDGHTYTPLHNLADNQGPLEIYNSPLSEAGVLGFDYGYSLDWPEALVIWEAQFGDFGNAAQVIIDQFLVSGEDKWNRLSGLVLLLPHGYEGQGPEHSSARLERYLALAAEDNMQIVNLTTPAQIFHCLRRQVLRKWRKPLVVMTPKSLLRLPAAVSSLDDLATGKFHKVLPDPVEPRGVSRILLCTGKIYYELVQQREELGRKDVAIVRVEQLYPLPTADLEAALANYSDTTPAYWVQEEPENMGAWRFLRIHWGERLFGRFPLQGISRPASASPAAGSQNRHKKEQKALLEQAFA